jgi:hypothetical protein
VNGFLVSEEFTGCLMQSGVVVCAQVEIARVSPKRLLCIIGASVLVSPRVLGTFGACFRFPALLSFSA